MQLSVTNSRTDELSVYVGAYSMQSYSMPKKESAATVVMPMSSLKADPMKIVFVGGDGGTVPTAASPVIDRNL